MPNVMDGEVGLTLDVPYDCADSDAGAGSTGAAGGKLLAAAVGIVIGIPNLQLYNHGQRFRDLVSIETVVAIEVHDEDCGDQRRD